MLDHDQDPRELPAIRILEEFSTCAGKLYWVAFVLSGDHEKARELILPAVDDMVDSHTFFGEWLCKWTIRIVITSCARGHISELSKQNRTGNRWRSKLVDHSSVKLRIPPVSRERLQRALLRIPLFPRFVFLLRVLERYPAVPDF